MSGMNWDRARERDRLRRSYDTQPYRDNGKVTLPNGEQVTVASLVDLADVKKICANCGTSKNGHHFTTWPGRERQICASCVHQLGLPASKPPKGPDGRRPRLPRARNLPHSTQSRVKRNHGAAPSEYGRQITTKKAGVCSICSGRIPAGVRASWDAALRLLTCRTCR